MVWQAVSSDGLPSDFFVFEKGSMNSEMYLKECIVKRLIPFIKKSYQNAKVLFWPDLATIHYTAAVLNILKQEKVYYVNNLLLTRTWILQIRPKYVASSVIGHFWSLNIRKRVFCLKMLLPSGVFTNLSPILFPMILCASLWDMLWLTFAEFIEMNLILYCNYVIETYTLCVTYHSLINVFACIWQFWLLLIFCLFFYWTHLIRSAHEKNSAQTYRNKMKTNVWNMLYFFIWKCIKFK